MVQNHGHLQKYLFVHIFYGMNFLQVEYIQCINFLIKTGSCSHSTAYKYFAQSIYFDMPLHGVRCNSLHDVKKGTCKSDQRAILGGEPGAMEQ